jgi:TolB-like protein/class 3 adenylate cyclase/Tfp pilus assembly protein PilF
MTQEGFKRKLAAILSADVEGYSRLMDDNEEATVRTITSYRSAITDLVQQFRGRIIDTPGDNILADFTSVVDAVNCAVEIQRELAERNAQLSDNRKMQFRIGVNLGDVIDEDGRIYGDGVNIAARVESLSEAGGICISGRAHDQVENKLGLEYEDLGKHEVKNISRPIQVYRVLSYPGAAAHRVVQAKEILGRKWRKIGFSAAAIVIVAVAIGIWQFYMRRPTVEPASVEKMAYPLPEKPSIAVLPFDNMSGDPNQDYFCDGLTENMITALSKTPKMFVIARNSTFTYKGKAVKVNQIAEELGVQYVLEGSVRKEGDRVRITAQLIDALTGHHLWAEKYDRELKEIFSLQDEITKKIISSLQVKLTEGEQAYVYAKGTDNLEAYLKAMKANWLNLNGTKDGVLKALDLAEEAIDLDPNYAFAYKVLGGAHGVTLWLQMSKNPRETLKRTIELHQRSVELNDSLAIAHAALGYWLMYVRQHDKAVTEGERAVILEPGSADTIHVYAAILTYAGRRKEAIPLFEEALRLNPKPPTAYLRHYGVALRDLGLYKEANAQAERAIKNEPDDLIAWVLLVSSLSLSGREEEARAAAKEVMRINPKFSVARIQKLTPHKDRAVAKRFGDGLRKAGLPEHPPKKASD